MAAGERAGPVEAPVDIPGQLIVEMRAGSHLYGTATARSDLDLKAVYVPRARDILLQRVAETIVIAPPKPAGQRNVAGDVDREILSLQRYLALLAQGQTMALDMLFAPDASMVRPPAPLWREIQANASRLVCGQAASFVTYCRQQANKYGDKGARVAAARRVLAALAGAEARLGSTARLGEAAEATALATGQGTGQAHIALVDLTMPGGQVVRHLEVCGKKMSFTSSLKTAREIAQRLVDAYGTRALQAERADGVDWKALSHAVRVGREAVELLTTGRITFPLPAAAEILAIKRGEVPYSRVAQTIEALLVEVEAAAAATSLRAAPDLDFIDDLVLRAHRAQMAVE